MLTSPDGTVAISNLGWVDRGSIWAYDVSGGPRLIPVNDQARYLGLVSAAGSDYVVVVHGIEDGTCVITVHAWSDLARQLACAKVSAHGVTFEGNFPALPAEMTAHVTSLGGPGRATTGYYLIELGLNAADIRRIDWFTDEKYDLGYQAVTSALPLPTGELLFGLTRSNQMVLCDSDLRVIRDVRMPGAAGGNAVPRFRCGTDEVWVVNYDTVARLDTKRLGVLASWVGQEPVGRSYMFVGEPWLRSDGRQFVVPRPAKGDVVELDADSLTPMRNWTTQGEPLTGALVGDDLVVRDWHSGRLLRPVGVTP